MENKEAIEELKEYHTTMDEYDLEYMEILISKELCDLSISALEKQVANEPVTEGVYGALYDACPVCGQAVDYCAFCPTCGQKLVEVSP